MRRRDVSKVLLAAAAGSAAVMAPRAQAQSCVTLCYPIASGENPALVFDTSYPPGHIRRYRSLSATNDLAAVQAAFNSSKLVHATVGDVFNCGTGTVNVPAHSRAMLHGVKLHTDVAGATFLNITGDDVEIHGVEIEGRGNASTAAVDVLVNFSGTSSASYREGLKLIDCHLHSSGFYGVYSQFGSNVEIRGCVIEHVGYAAVMALSAANWIVNENRIDDVSPGSSGNAYGIAFTRDGSSGSLATYPASIDCQACNNLIQNVPSWEGLDTHGGQRITFSGNTIISCALGINVGPVPSINLAPADIVITNNIIHAGSTGANAYRGIGSGGTATSRAARIVCSGNVLSDFGRTFGSNTLDDGAVMFQHTDALIISGNIIGNSRSNAICMAADNQNFLVNDNVVRYLLGLVSSSAGVNIRSSAQTGRVADNYIDATAQHALSIAAGSDVMFGQNKLISSGTKINGAINGGEGLELTGSVVTDRPSIAALASNSFTFTVTGAEVGDECQITTSSALGLLMIDGRVTAANTVTCLLFNPTGASYDPPSTTYTAVVRKR